MKKWCVLFVIGVFFTYVQPSFSSSVKNIEQSISTDEVQFRQELGGFFSALENKDWDKFFGYFPTKDQHEFLAILSSKETLPATIKSKEELQNLYRPVMFKDNATTFKAHVKHVVVNGDLAYAESDNDIFVDGEGEKDDISYSVNIVFVFKKIAGCWYFIFDYNRPISKEA